MKYTFSSAREKRLWIWVLVVVLGIYALIFIGRPLSGYLRDRALLTNAFWVAIYLTLGTVLWHGWKRRIGRREIGIWMGVAAIYLLLFLRMASPEERSHLIEYSVLAVFIHEALRERQRNGIKVWRPAVLAVALSSGIGILDELIQLLVPSRVFDPIDLVFNTGASIIAMVASSVIRWVRRRFQKDDVQV